MYGILIMVAILTQADAPNAAERVREGSKIALCITKTTPLFQQRGLTTCSIKENEMADESVAVEYREIPGFDNYRVGNDGSVWSKQSGQWSPLKPTVLSSGYEQVYLYRDHHKHHRSVHCLVLEAFIGPRPDGMQACHFPDQNRRNNKLNNLRWDTPKGNSADRTDHGTQPVGEKNPIALLTERDVLAIRFAYAAGGVTMQQLGQRYGVDWTAISHVLTGKNWSHVGGPTSTRKRKLSLNDAREMRSMYPATSSFEIARRFGVAHSTARAILCGNRHPEPESQKSA